MYTIENNQFRNLEEQVQKNKEDIAKHYAVDRALSNLGIKVVGQVANEEELPDPLTYVGEFGDTYAVGDKEEVDAGNATYTYYVWTRPDLNAGQPNAYWLNVGAISVVGPQGLRGPEGKQGPQGNSTKWYTGYTNPTSAAGYNVGDLYLNTNTGNVFVYGNGSWSSPQGNIKGPQGIQGPKGNDGIQGPAGEPGPQGPRGDVGGFINIVGTLSSVDQLPLPTALNNLTYAYLVTHGEHSDLYIQVGESVEEAEWFNAGPFNAATLVTVGGEGQNVWNADSKLDKYTNVTEYNQVYVKAANGGEGTINVTKQAIADAVVQRQSDGNIYVPEIPAEGVDAASKAYVDNQLNNRVATTSEANKVYVTDANGNQTTDARIIRQSTASYIPPGWIDFTDEEKEANYPYTCQKSFGYTQYIGSAKKITLLYNKNVAKYGISLVSVTGDGQTTFYAVRKPTGNEYLTMNFELEM